MIKLTWEWLGMTPALDLANTVTIEDGAERDLIADPGDFARWVAVEATFLGAESGKVLQRERAALLELREVIRRVVAALASQTRPRKADLRRLNLVSSAACEWLEVDEDTLVLRQISSAGARERVLARYARSALELVAGDTKLRQCPAPSCGMFYLESRQAQRWCSPQCGSRARVSRHYKKRRGITPRDVPRPEGRLVR